MATDRLIAIVDDDPGVRQSLKFLLESVHMKCQTFASADDLLRWLGSPRPAGTPATGCAIVDVRMPGMSGLELQERLAKSEPGLPMIIVTGHGDVPMAVRAMRAGAFGFLTKPYQDQELIDQVNAALMRESLTRQHAEFKAGVLRRRESLTPREAEVMTLVVDGLANKQIAAQLDVAEKTVETHRANVMRKMEAESLAHLVRMALAVE